jgi:hypothetical protein
MSEAERIVGQEGSLFWSIGQRRLCIKYLLVFVHLVNDNTHEIRKVLVLRISVNNRPSTVHASFHFGIPALD